MRKNVTRYIPIMIITAVACVILHSIIFVNYMVDGKSMEPTLDDGNMLAVNRIAYSVKKVKRFDVVVFHANKDEDYVKRIIALPGDEVEYRDNTLYINGKAVEEPFLEKKKRENSEYTQDFTLKQLTGKTAVPDDALFVMGDNRPESFDSRSFGFVYKDQLVGRVDTDWASADGASNVWQIAILPLVSLLK